jgi:drug/metabolite transporter (DMT)-like permease
MVTRVHHPKIRKEMQFGPKFRASQYILLLALSTVWGASYSFIKVGVETIPPVTLIAGRTLIAGILLIALMRILGIALPRDGATWRKFMFQACLNSVVPFTLIAWAEQTVDASAATILNSTGPVFTFLMTWGWTRHEATSSLKLFGVIAGLGGVVLIVGVEALGGIGRELVAQLAIVAATLCYAGAAIFGRSFSGLHPMVPAAGSMLAGAVILMPMSIVLEYPWQIAPSARSLLALLGLAVLSTALAFVIYFRLIQTIGSVATTAQAYLRVPIGVAFGILFLGETPTATLWLGLLCVLVGIAAMTMPARTHP